MRSLLVISVFLVLAIASATVRAQVVDSTPSPMTKSGETSKSSSFLETLQKMRIENEKKEHKEMLERGERILKLSEDLEKSFLKKGSLTKENYNQIALIEKLAKKIRDDLGGDDDGDKTVQQMASSTEAVQTLRERVVKLYEELKKTTRFSISATAIEGTNAVLKIVRLLRVSK